ncbi:hypothetical protein HPB49_008468 [Dermacentor silvarum]|uniref:Uncharacterized protein n=1 Tax=Dermacentor silvarum TaxID=543639 RepID=A0ACB8D3I3_DERSI|nr:hypothetical protein HPB49_008468 [Dermacentor silvarum]
MADEVGNCGRLTAPAALQPTDAFEPVTVELPVTSDEEVMDESTSGKRGRDSEDEEEVPKQSKGLGALPDSKRKLLTPPFGSAAGEGAPDAATAATGAVAPAATTPTAEKTASTAVPGRPATAFTRVTVSQATCDTVVVQVEASLLYASLTLFPRQNLASLSLTERCCNIVQLTSWKGISSQPQTLQRKSRIKRKQQRPSAPLQLAHPLLVPALCRTPQRLAQQAPHSRQTTNSRRLRPSGEQVAALCNKPFQLHELTKALDRSRRRSAPGVDGITFQMLRNLADAERARLLDCLNTVWTSVQLPESWLTAIVVPILKARKPATAPSSHRPVSLTSAACKLMEYMALARLVCISRMLDFFPEQQSGFQSRPGTADSIGDVV